MVLLYSRIMKIRLKIASLSGNINIKKEYNTYNSYLV